MTCCARCTRKPYLTTCGNENCRCHPEARREATLKALQEKQARLRHASAIAERTNHALAREAD